MRRHPLQRTKKQGWRREWFTSISGPQDSFADLAATHSVGELQELLVVGMESSNLGMPKIEAEHPIPGLDRLAASLNERRATSFGMFRFP